jgi:hypothetical protein
MTDMDSEKGKNAPVEKLMMERAQGEAVAFFIRTAGLMPFDVRRLDSDEYITAPNIETAHRAAI